jgi:hypothetical protein
MSEILAVSLLLWGGGMDAQIKVKDNSEFYDYLESLTERKMYGEVTFYMQGGNIENCRISERKTKTELKAEMEAQKKSQPRVLITRPKVKNVNG